MELIDVKSVLLLGNYRPTFVLASSLKKRGYRVICGLDGYDRGAEVSKYVDAVWQHPPYTSNLPGFQSALDAFLETHADITDVYPIAEPLIRAFAAERLSLPSGVRLGSMANNLVTSCLDKQNLLSKARDLTVPVAPFTETTGQEHFYHQADEIGFPLVIRPLSSDMMLRNKKAITCQDKESLNSLNDVWKACEYKLLIQRHAAGKRDNIYFAASEGKIFRYLHAKITRTDQPDGSGLAVEGETISPCPILKKHTETLVRALNYEGIGCAQFLVEPVTGEISFLELNPRLAGNHALPEACGLALGDCLINLTEGRVVAAPYVEGSIGKKYSWIAGEIDSLKKAWKAGRITFGQMLTSARKAYASFRRDDLDIAFVPNDRLPGIFTLVDSLPLLGGISRQRFQQPLFFKLLVRKVYL